MKTSRKPELLVDMFPELSAELEQLLRVSGEHALADQIPRLRVLDRCRCGDDFCATFYTQPKPKGSYGPGLQTLALEPVTGDLIIDVLDGAVAKVEVLYRDEIRRKLLTKFPDKP
ncbi:MAG TPA: hypothetical protein VN037_11570 [Verrucomicrobiae bacterium]|jgi:hypothetical protein|nr:hypothetical protein [Verrucomicrobiae bacterium]